MLDATALEELGDRIIEVIRTMKGTGTGTVPATGTGERELWHFTMFMAPEAQADEPAVEPAP